MSQYQSQPLQYQSQPVQYREQQSVAQPMVVQQESPSSVVPLVLSVVLFLIIAVVYYLLNSSQKSGAAALQISITAQADQIAQVSASTQQSIAQVQASGANSDVQAQKITAIVIASQSAIATAQTNIQNLQSQLAAQATQNAAAISAAQSIDTAQTASKAAAAQAQTASLSIQASQNAQSASASAAIAAINADQDARTSQANQVIAGLAANANTQAQFASATASITAIQNAQSASVAQAAANITAIKITQTALDIQAVGLLNVFQTYQVGKVPGYLPVFMATYHNRVVRCAVTGAQYYIENGTKRFISQAGMTGDLDVIDAPCGILGWIPNGANYVSGSASGNNGGVTCNQFCTGHWGRDQLGSGNPTFKGARANSLISNSTCGCTLTNDPTWAWPVGITGAADGASCYEHCSSASAQAQLESQWPYAMGAVPDPTGSSESGSDGSCECKPSDSHVWPGYDWNDRNLGRQQDQLGKDIFSNLYKMSESQRLDDLKKYNIDVKRQQLPTLPTLPTLQSVGDASNVQIAAQQAADQAAAQQAAAKIAAQQSVGDVSNVQIAAQQIAAQIAAQQAAQQAAAQQAAAQAAAQQAAQAAAQAVAQAVALRFF